MVNELLKGGADPNLQWIYDGSGETAYRLALKQGHDEVADRLRKVTSPELVAEADIAISPAGDDDVKQAKLLKAVEENDLNAARKCLEANVDPNCRSESDVIVFHNAVRAGEAMTRLLLPSLIKPIKRRKSQSS